MASSSPAATAPLLNTTAPTDPDASSEHVYTVVLVVYLVVLPAIWIAPPAVSFFCRRLGDVLRGAGPVTASPVDASVNQLEVAEEARRKLHARVNHSVWQLGWMLLHAGLTPFYIVNLVRMGVSIIDIQPVVGSYVLHTTIAVPGVLLLLLSVLLVREVPVVLVLLVVLIQPFW